MELRVRPWVRARARVRFRIRVRVRGKAKPRIRIQIWFKVRVGGQPLGGLTAVLLISMAPDMALGAVITLSIMITLETTVTWGPLSPEGAAEIFISWTTHPSWWALRCCGAGPIITLTLPQPQP